MKLDHMLTDEDVDILYEHGIHTPACSWIATMLADQTDAQIMRRLLKTRRNNVKARAHAEQYSTATVGA